MTDFGNPNEAAPVSLAKVTLTKASPRVSLDKSAHGGVLTVNLNWNARGPQAAPQGKRGWLSKFQSALQPDAGIDLDLGCLWEFTDGSKGVVQALGNAFQARDTNGRTVISLDGDDRSGSAAGGENMRIDLSQAEAIRRILVFALIYEGTPNWEQAQGVVTLVYPGAAPVEVRLDDAGGQAKICAIALIEHTAGELSVLREVRYVNGAQDALDRAYGWGLNWAPGRK